MIYGTHKVWKTPALDLDLVQGRNRKTSAKASRYVVRGSIRWESGLEHPILISSLTNKIFSKVSNILLTV